MLLEPSAGIPYKGARGCCPPSAPAPAGEAQILPDIRDESKQYLFKKLMGTATSQLFR